ncbi:MAG: YbhB/YbcL family Raf kinase inhibitor-like protein [Alphaproteobacteria bacterium]|nr:YbhB/YbcL family Raf kinase inhibitor-like protein [Alphaproteobacteria bacterium]
MTRITGLAALAMAGALGAAACAQVPAKTPSAPPQLAGQTAKQLTYELIKAKGETPLSVSSTSFSPGGKIPSANTAYGDNRSPQLSWSGAPDGVTSYLVILEDPDVGPKKPFTHWIIGNLPPTTTSLPEGLTTSPPGAFQTGARGDSYFGPRPPAGSGVHNYTFEVFALDTKLDLKDGAKLAEVQGAMTEHVLASGVMQATSQAPGEGGG